MITLGSATSLFIQGSSGFLPSDSNIFYVNESGSFLKFTGVAKQVYTGSVPPPDNLTASLEHYWTMDVASPVEDSVGSVDINAAFSGFTSEGKISGSRFTNGVTTSYIRTDDMAATSSLIGRSISVWANPNITSSAFTHGFMGLSTYGPTEGPPDYRHFQVLVETDASSTTGSFYIWCNYPSSSIRYENSLYSGSWGHHVFLFPASGSITDMQVYSNNTLLTPVESSDNGTIDLGIKRISLATGFAYHDRSTTQDIGTDTFLAGKYDELGYWETVISTSSISDLYNSGSGLPFGQFE